VDDQKNIPASAKEAIEMLKNNGVYVVIATGRAPFMFEDIRKELKVESFVSFNGQYIVFEGEIIYENPIGEEALSKLYEASSANNYPMVFMCDKDIRATAENHPQIKESLGKLKLNYPLVDANYFRNRTIYQALLFCDGEAELQYKERFGKFEFIRWHRYSVDVLPTGGSKANGIKHLIHHLGLDLQHAYAFGDGLNDMEMLKLIPNSVAMGNAEDSVKEVAMHITKDVNHDGVFHGLKIVGLL
jgi:Cof subfamily protein (haloacid dehalogenase superfamily)